MDSRGSSNMEVLTNHSWLVGILKEYIRSKDYRGSSTTLPI
jgi:hypothetical protein